MTPDELWRFLPIGYLLTVLIETPILVLGLSKIHPLRRKLFAGLWLTACTYPVVVLVLPAFFDIMNDRFRYLLIAETFAPLAECTLFFAAFGQKGVPVRTHVRDAITIITANLASFIAGEALLIWWIGNGSMP